MSVVPHWTKLGIRRMPPMSARTPVEPIPPPIQPLIDERLAWLASPLKGITTDGTPIPGLYPIRDGGPSAKPIAEAAQAWLAALTPEQRVQATYPLDAEERRCWINVHMSFFRHGVMLEDLPMATRELGLDILRATLSERGFDQARQIMRINELLAELSESPDEYGEWPYFMTVFGDSAGDEPWGWQIDGHHLNINCTVIGDQVSWTPTFMGSEPCAIYEGPLAGTMMFVPEEQGGLDLYRSLSAAQAERALSYSSIHPDDIPRELQHPFDGRMMGGAYHDNITLGYEGVSAADFSDAQRQLLRTLVASYIGWSTDGHAEVQMADFDAHIDETHLAWMGASDDEGPFYYRVHSPVVLIEFDHHPGVVFDNEVPSRNHIHTLVRVPNGGDYGVDLLRQHHERYDHSHGHHHPRE